LKTTFRPLIPFLLIVALPIVAVAIAATWLQDAPLFAELVARARAAAGEWWSVPLFIVLYALFTLVLLPVSPLSIAAALAWGWKAGGAIELIACTLAALPPFELARRGLAERIARRVKMPSFAGEPELFPLFILRLVPVVPYSALNYIAGLARFRRRDYVVATFVGSIPSVFLFVWFVDTLGASATTGFNQLRLIGACLAIALFAVLGRLAARRVRQLVKFDS
jgi:uncharacterized membrane protein YdjX (TVP38/TMEM64 family)